MANVSQTGVYERGTHYSDPAHCSEEENEPKCIQSSEDCDEKPEIQILVYIIFLHM